MSATFAERLETVPASLIEGYVRSVVGRDDVRVTGWAVKPLGGGFATAAVGGHGTLRVAGDADVGGTAVSWTLIVKSIQHTPGVGSEDERFWNYWKREVLAYQSGLLADLGNGLRAPRCYGVTSHPNGEFWIWQEDIRNALEDWPFEQYGVVAYDLGLFNAELARRRIEPQGWFVDGRAENWIEWQAPNLNEFRSMLSEVGVHWYQEHDIQRVEQVWRHADVLISALRRQPRTLCHHDAFRRNLFSTPDGTVAIDWAILGTGALGEDIMPLVAVSLQFMDVDWEKANDLEKEVVDGYLRALREAGLDHDENGVRLTYTASLGLMVGLANTAYFRHFKDAEGHRRVEDIIGRPFEEVRQRFSVLQTWALDRAEQALDMVGRH